MCNCSLRLLSNVKRGLTFAPACKLAPACRLTFIQCEERGQFWMLQSAKFSESGSFSRSCTNTANVWASALSSAQRIFQQTGCGAQGHFLNCLTVLTRRGVLDICLNQFIVITTTQQKTTEKYTEISFAVFHFGFCIKNVLNKCGNMSVEVAGNQFGAPGLLIMFGKPGSKHWVCTSADLVIQRSRYTARHEGGTGETRWFNILNV